MNLKDIVAPLVEKLKESASVKTVYGDPIEVQGKTIIPVAKAAYGFGTLNGREGEPAQAPETRSQQVLDDLVNTPKAGGGINVTPVGVLEVTPEDTRFIAAPGNNIRILGAMAAGLAFGVALIALNRSRKRRELSD